MNRSPRLFVLALVFVAAVITWGGGNALAQGNPVAWNSTAVLTPSPPPGVSMCQVPDGTGTPFTNCYEFGGRQISAMITVTLNPAVGPPVAGVPASNIRLEEAGSPLVWCRTALYPPPFHAPNFADGPTNAAGQTTFTMSYHGGHWVLGPTYVWLLEADGLWYRIPTPVNVSYNSPDINGIFDPKGNLIVNLVDLRLFAGDYFAPTYTYRSDFNFDGFINLPDLAIFAQAFGRSCF